MSFLALSNAVMSAFQIVVGIYGHSDALVADGLHTFLDLLMDGVTYAACKLANRPADQSHPYGYKRVETLACLILSFLLCVIGVGIVYESIFIRDMHSVRSDLVIAVSAMTMVINECLYRYADAKARVVNSDLLAASASHQRSDALSSLIVLFSAIFDILIPNYHFDGIAAIIIGAFIFKMGVKIAYKGILELLDGGISRSRQLAIESYMQSLPGVVGVHCLRTRKQAGDICLDAHIITSPFISVSEGHFIGEQLRQSVMRRFKDIVDVVVHIDSEDDTYLHDKGSKLPGRVAIEETITSVIESYQLPEYETTIHYHNEELYVTIMFDSLLSKRDAKQFSSDLKQAFSGRDFTIYISVFRKIL